MWKLIRVMRVVPGIAVLAAASCAPAKGGGIQVIKSGSRRGSFSRDPARLGNARSDRNRGRRRSLKSAFSVRLAHHATELTDLS